MNVRADMYALLAELLAEPPEWMSLPGREWPLFDTLTGLSADWQPANRHLENLAGLPAETPGRRLERYSALFASGRPRFWLYESAARAGKILGETAFEVARLYHAAGLEVSGAELPDHISLELAFLSHLAGQPDTLPYEKQFLEQRGDWMLNLGRALQKSGDEVYALIGGLLADWLASTLTPIPLPLGEGQGARVPTLPRPDECTLCGFCAQVCPTHALKVMQNAAGNYLALTVAACNGCGKCEPVCDPHALVMGAASLEKPSDETLILRRSPHALCQKCGKPIASQAEMDYIARQVGDAPWQHLCLDCRAYAIR